MKAEPPQVLFFDIGNVLLFFSHQKMFEQVAAVCETDLPEIQTFFNDNSRQLRYEAGQITTEELYRDLSTIAGRPLNSEDVHNALSDIFHVNEPLLPVICSLREQKIRIIALSNISESHHTYINDQYGLFDPFDDVVLSYQVGAVKPNAKIFETALSIAGCSPERCFYTDDIPDYIQAARALSIDAEPFTGVEDLRRQLSMRGIEV